MAGPLVLPLQVISETSLRGPLNFNVRLRWWQEYICHEKARVSVTQFHTSKPTTTLFHDPSLPVLA